MIRQGKNSQIRCVTISIILQAIVPELWIFYFSRHMQYNFVNFAHKPRIIEIDCSNYLINARYRDICISFCCFDICNIDCCSLKLDAFRTIRSLNKLGKPEFLWRYSVSFSDFLCLRILFFSPHMNHIYRLALNPKKSDFRDIVISNLC